LQRSTFTITLNYIKSIGDYNFNILTGTEIVEFKREQIGGDRSGYYPFTDQSFWVLDRCNPVGQNNFSSVSEEALY